MTENNEPQPELEITAAEGSLEPAAVNGHAVTTYALPTNTKHVKDYVKVLYKRRWLVSSAFLIVFVATAVYTYTTVSVYQAHAKILIETEEPNYIKFQEVAQQGLSGADYYQTQYDLLKSRSLAKRTLASLKMADPFPRPSKPPLSIARLVNAPINWVIGLFAGSPASGSTAQPIPADEAGKESRAVDTLLAGLFVSPVRNSRVVDLQFRSTDPQLAMLIVNAHARGYIEQNTEFKFLSSKEASDWLADRLAEQRAQVDKAELFLQRYREQHSVIPPEDTSNLVVRNLAELNSAYTKAKTERLAKEALYQQLKAIQNDPAALDALPAILTNATIQSGRVELAALKRTEAELAQNLGPNNGKLIAVRTSIQGMTTRLAAEMHNVVEGVRNDYEGALAQEQSLNQALQAQTREALSLGRESIEFGVLQREAESSRQVYQALLQKSKEIGVSSELRTTNVRVVDYAELPRSPFSPNRQANMAFGLFGGLLTGVLLGFFFEYLDNRLKTPDEIKVHLGLPSLGLLPLVRQMDPSHPYPVFNGPLWPKLNEAFRTLRTNVVFSSAHQGSRSVVVTSTGPNEGKTLVSSNLAISLAEAGPRVLLIDADLRRPALHQIFDLPQEPGLSNLLVGGSKASEVVRKTSVPGLWILPAGRIPPNPAELLGSARFVDFLNSLRDHFDWVVIDTPPVMAVADASVVAHHATGVVFVIRAEMVSRFAAQTAIEQLENTRANIIGAVLNRVDLDRQAYYYSKYYRKEYSDYYSTTKS